MTRDDDLIGALERIADSLDRLNKRLDTSLPEMAEALYGIDDKITSALRAAL